MRPLVIVVKLDVFEDLWITLDHQLHGLAP